jgi:hypothetical protein
MSSKPKIVIAPKKKKPLIILSKQQLQQQRPSAGAGVVGRSTSPNTVASAAAAAPTITNASSIGSGGGGIAMGGGVNNANNIKKNKSSSSSSAIIIRPFTKPPELPSDFYDTSLHTLRRALNCVLRHEAMMEEEDAATIGSISAGGDGGDGGGGGGSSRRLIGREELYRTVEDLCVHKFGTRLYYDLVSIMEEAASEVVRRLATNATTTTTSSSSWDHPPLIDHNNKDSMMEVVVVGRGWDASLDAIMDCVAGNVVGYNATQLINDLNLRDGGSSDVGCGGGAVSDTEVVGVEYSDKRYALLARMQSICRVSYAEEYLTFLRSIFLSLDRAYVYYADVDLEEIGSESEQRKRMMRQQHSATRDGDANSTVSSSPPPGGRVIERSAAASASNPRVWGLWDVGIACLRQHMLLHTPNAPDHSNMITIPVLTTMILTTTYALLSEFDHPHTSFSSSMSDTRPLTRNCVRTIIDLGALPALLEEVIVVASARFENEGKSWGIFLNEGKKSAPEFLLHVEHRLRQSRGLAGYYLPGNSASVAAMRRLSRLKFLTGTVISPIRQLNKVVWSPANDSTRRIFPALIETQLLGPHLSLPDAGIFEARHLYPMLDDDMGIGGDMAWKTQPGGSKLFENAKRLYGLCWRLTASVIHTQNTAHPPSGIAQPSSPVYALDLLRQAFGKYGRLRGNEIVQQGISKQTSDGSKTNTSSKELEKKVIPDLLAFKHHLNSLHTMAFQGDESFGVMVRSILDDVMNGSDTGPSLTDEGEGGDGGRRTAELLAKHVDMRFKDAKASAAPEASSSSTNLFTDLFAASTNLFAAAIATDANESFQNEIFALFRHLHSKDVFEAFYKRDLAKRLLTGRAVSTDMEWSFLTKLKAECGAAYTSKMEGMFNDMELSRDIMSSYAAYSAGAATFSAGGGPMGKVVDMDVQVLTTGYWPVYPKYPNIILPPELLIPRTKFETYYLEKYQGRRITWQYSLGNCIVKACFPKSVAPKELVVNMCQSLVLLCFNVVDGDMGLTLDDIMKKTGIDDRPELERVLQSLSMGRDGTRVLRKVDYDSPTQHLSPSKTSDSNNDGAKKQRVRRNVGPYDRFLFNSSFTSNQRRIRITNITMKETTEERTRTHEAVSKDRLYFIDAAVVRIMKARKAIDHRDLIGEVMAQLKFPATAADIKKRVESLIEREYMERVEGDRSKYKYLA